MLDEFRYQCVAQNGRKVQGTVLANNQSKAKKLIDKVAQRHRLEVKSIQKKRSFLYTVKGPEGKKIKGRQSAFSKEEVAEALAKMGYQNPRIEPVLFDFKTKPPFASVMMFIQLSSFLLKEKLSYDKILRMLAEEESNATLKETLKSIESELKKGKDGTEVFSRYSDVFGKFPAYMLGLATRSGNMAEVYEATAKFMERSAEYRKSIKKAFMSPMFTVLAMSAAVVYYIVDIFPSTANMFIKFGMDVPPMTAATLKISDYLAANWFFLFLWIAVPVGVIAVWWSTPNGRVWRDHFIIKLPVIGKLMHKSAIEIFFRVFAAIYSGSENNIETLKASAEACNNAYIEKGVKEVTIPLMLKEGKALAPALEAAKVFNQTTLSRIRTGAEVGNVLQSAKMICLFYERETTYKMQGVIDSIQSFIGAFIAIVITALTIVSAEVALVSPPTPGM